MLAMVNARIRLELDTEKTWSLQQSVRSEWNGPLLVVGNSSLTS